MKITRTLVRAGMVMAATAMLVAGSAATAGAGPGSTGLAASVQAAQSDGYGTESISDCTDILENFGYTVTTVRLVACVTAGVIGTPQAIAGCAATLIGTGVFPPVASGACIASIA